MSKEAKNSQEIPFSEAVDIFCDLARTGNSKFRTTGTIKSNDYAIEAYSQIRKSASWQRHRYTGAILTTDRHNSISRGAEDISFMLVLKSLARIATSEEDLCLVVERIQDIPPQEDQRERRPSAARLIIGAVATRHYSICQNPKPLATALRDISDKMSVQGNIIIQELLKDELIGESVFDIYAQKKNLDHTRFGQFVTEYDAAGMVPVEFWRDVVLRMSGFTQHPQALDVIHDKLMTQKDYIHIPHDERELFIRQTLTNTLNCLLVDPERKGDIIDAVNTELDDYLKTGNPSKAMHVTLPQLYEHVIAHKKKVLYRDEPRRRVSDVVLPFLRLTQSEVPEVRSRQHYYDTKYVEILDRLTD